MTTWIIIACSSLCVILSVALTLLGRKIERLKEQNYLLQEDLESQRLRAESYKNDITSLHARIKELKKIDEKKESKLKKVKEKATMPQKGDSKARLDLLNNSTAADK